MKIMYDGKVVSNTVTTYENLQGKPMINSVELKGNVSSSQLNLYNKAEVDNMFASMRSIKVVEALPDIPTANTMYYVGVSHPYHVYLFDNMRQRIDLGESDTDMTEYQKKVDDDLQTVSKNVVGGINEVNANIGKLSELTTTEKTTVVDAVNEVEELAKSKRDYLGTNWPIPIHGLVNHSGAAGAGVIWKLFEWHQATWEMNKIDFIVSDTRYGQQDAIFTLDIRSNGDTGSTIDAIQLTQMSGGSCILDSGTFALAHAVSADKKKVTMYLLTTAYIANPIVNYTIIAYHRRTVRPKETICLTPINQEVASLDPYSSITAYTRHSNKATSVIPAANWAKWISPARSLCVPISNYADQCWMLQSSVAGMSLCMSDCLKITHSKDACQVNYFQGTYDKAHGGNNWWTGQGFFYDASGKAFNIYVIQFNSAAQIKVFYINPATQTYNTYTFANPVVAGNIYFL